MASMGPPIFIGGNPGSLTRNDTIVRQLQWGRRFSSAEMSDAAGKLWRTTMLQWGRRFSSAEINQT